MVADDAIMTVTFKIVKTLDEGKKCLGIFLDLKKASDTVCHKILLNKIEKIGITVTSLNLCRSYLTNRYKDTQINKEK